jgi:hypothetical protein
MDVATRGGPAALPIKIHTSAPVLDFFLTHAPFAVSLQDAMAIILKGSQAEMFLATEELATFIQRCKSEVTIDEAMVYFKADETLEVRWKKMTEDEVSLVAPRLEVRVTGGHECSRPHDVSYEPGCDTELCVIVGTKSYSDTNAEESAPATTETQGDSSKETEYEVMISDLKAESHWNNMDLCTGDTKWITARVTFKVKKGSHVGFTAQYVLEDMKEVTARQVVDPHTAGSGGHQD